MSIKIKLVCLVSLKNNLYEPSLICVILRCKVLLRYRSKKIQWNNLIPEVFPEDKPNTVTSDPELQMQETKETVPLCALHHHMCEAEMSESTSWLSLHGSVQ